MRAFVTAVSILAAVVAAVSTSSGTLTVDIYADDGCGGSIEHTFSPKVGTCDARHHKGAADKDKGPESFLFTTPVASDIAKFTHSSGMNCSHAEKSEYVACGVCSANRESGKFFMLHCSTSGQYATFSHDCNEGCTTCTHDHEKIMVGSCHADKRNSTQEMKFASLSSGYTFTAKQWASSTSCSGNPTHEETMATDVCERRVKYTWSA